MNISEQKKQAKAFIKRWENRGNERQDSQPFWLDLLRSVYGIENPETYISFEDKVMLDHTSFIDGFIDKTKVLIEQKGADKDLNKAITQSDGSKLTPFQQAKRYSANLPYSSRPRWIVTSNFKEFYIYDMEQPNSEAIVVKLADLETEYYRLEFLVEKSNLHIEREMHISMQAGEIVGKIYEALLAQYVNPDNEDSLKSINQLCVRLVFCLYAEDAGIFGKHGMFHDYLVDFDARFFRKALIELFEVLNTPIDQRDPYLDEALAAFPYVNGGMFADSRIEIPQFTEELRELILKNASSDFDWSEISPTIFGAVFESTLNPETRHAGGMHYTSIENIHKVIDPLFLDELRNELDEIRTIKQFHNMKSRLEAYQRKLANLTFFDPACGSGNFLTETYLSLRHLENEAIKLIHGDNVLLDTEQSLIKVHLDQFYGIEINDFAVSVAKTALWIAESQMMEKTKEIVYSNDSFLSLKSYTNIVEGNALALDWETVVPKDRLNYIIGNPPFLGKKEQSKEQKTNLVELFGKRSGKLDYVCGWYSKAALLIENTSVKAAFVSTNSITQGEQVAQLWSNLYQHDMEIIFCHQSFVWKNETKDGAHVHCVIIGFSDSKQNIKEKYIFGNKDKVEKVTNISPYLISASSTFIDNRSKPIYEVPEISYGSMPIDNGNLILSKEDLDIVTSEKSNAVQFVRPYLGGQELLKGHPRWCLWLKDASPRDLASSKFILDRIQKTRDFRLSSKRKQTLALADTPHLFGEIRQPETAMLVIPKVSSERRRYIPVGFVEPTTIVNGSALIVPDADLFTLGVIISNVHMAWMRTVAGRMKSDYQYSGTIVYNNFPWPSPSEKTKAKIEQTAQAILDARALYPDSSLADLYDELTMPAELRRAHQANDKAVMEAYGFTKIADGKKTWLTESETVEKLFEMYEEMTKK